MTPEETLDWLAQQHFDQCREERPIQDWIRKMKSQLPVQPAAVVEPHMSEQHKQRSVSEHLEPVAWLQIGVGPLHEGHVIARTTKPKEWNPEWWKFEPLYTTPQRKPLTPEQIAELDCLDHFKFARAIEAAYDIKE